MAGIGIELKKVLKKGTISSTLRAYTYSAIITSGPYVISILTILLIGIVVAKYTAPEKARAFQVIVTYIIAFSLILTSPFQLTYTRYVADKTFQKEYTKVLPALNAVLTISFLMSFLFSTTLSLLFFTDIGVLFSILFTINVVLFSGIWILNILLTSLKNYRFIVFSFIAGFLTAFVLSIYLSKMYGLNGLLFSLLAGVWILFVLMYSYIVKEYPSEKLLDFEVFDTKKIYVSLIFVGIFYNLAIWIDKFIFWYHPDTSEKVLSIFRASLLYDVPIFLAYLAIIPGLAVLLLRIETDYLEYYDRYYRAIREGETLNRIFFYGEQLGIQARNTLIDVLLVQLITDILIILLVDKILGFFDIPVKYAHLLYVDLIGTTLQLFTISILAFLFYFDRKMEALVVSFLFLIFNAVLSLITIYLGPLFYGYGFTISLLIASISGLLLMRNFLRGLHYETYMLG